MAIINHPNVRIVEPEAGVYNPAGFHPSKVPGYKVDCQMYNADHMTLTDSNKVRYVENLGPDGDDFRLVQNSDVFKPIYEGDGLQFDASASQRMDFGTVAGAFDFAHDGTGMAIYIVGKIPSSADNTRGGIISSSSNGSSNPGFILSFNDLNSWGADRQFRFLMGNGSASVYSEFVGNPNAGDPAYEFDDIFVVGVRDSAANALRIDVDQEISDTDTIANAHGGSGITTPQLGVYAGFYFEGTIYHALVFDQEPSDKDHVKIMTYLQEQAAKMLDLETYLGDRALLFVHADFGRVINASNVVTEWNNIFTQSEVAWNHSGAVYDSTGFNGKGAMRLVGPVDVPIQVNRDGGVFIVGDLDNNLLRAMLVVDGPLTDNEITTITNYLGVIA